MGFYAQLRDNLTVGIAKDCVQITADERKKLAQVFNMGIRVAPSSNAVVKATLGRPDMYKCESWNAHVGTAWFGSLLAHAMSHIAGYQKPEFTADMTFKSACLASGTHDHCTSEQA